MVCSLDFIQTTDHEDLLHKAQLVLLVHMLQEPAFDQLRTKEQLGYIVWTTSRRTPDGPSGLRIIIQSEREASYLEQRIEAFLISFAVIRINQLH